MKCGPFLISLTLHAALVAALVVAARPRDLPPRIAMTSGTGENGGGSSPIVMSDQADWPAIAPMDAGIPVAPSEGANVTISSDQQLPNVNLPSYLDDVPGGDGAAPSAFGDFDLPLAGVVTVAAASEPEMPQLARQARQSAAATGDNGDGAGVGDGAPRALANNRLPAYPAEARRQGIEGVVVLRIEVRADGSVGDVSIDRSSGSAMLDRPAIERAREWTFAPAMQYGRAIACQITYPIEFKLRRG